MSAFNQAIWNEVDLSRRAIRKPAAQVAAQQGPLIHIPVDVAAAGDNVLLPGVSGLAITIYELELWNLEEQDVTLQDSAGKIYFDIPTMPAKVGYSRQRSEEALFQCGPGAAFVAVLGVGTRLTGFFKARLE